MVERTLDEIIADYREANERLRAPTPGVQPMWTPPPAPMPQYPAPQVLQQATQLSYMSMRLTPPPPMIGPTAAPGGMFTDPYESAIQQQLSRQAGYLDPSRAGSYMGRGMVRQWGERYGGVAGGIMGGLAGAGGGPAGVAAGASWGASIGGALGEYLPDIPLLGPAISWGVGQFHAEAAQQLSRTARLQQGTRGLVQMGRGETGLGGTGMTGQAALDLAQRLQGMETEAFNVNDLINLTVTGAQTGMLMGAADVATIAERVKGLMRIVGEMARLTGDPDFRRNLQQIADLRRTGFSVEQAVGFIGDLGVYGRTAGMAPGQVMQAGGVAGGQIFQQYGMARAPGVQLGARNFAMAQAGIGAFTPIQQDLFGGARGIGEAGTQQQARFLTQFMTPLMGALMERGEGGESRLSREKILQLPGLLAEGKFKELIFQSQAFIGQQGPRGIAQFKRQLPELLSEFAQQYAPAIPGMLTTAMTGLAQRPEFGGDIGMAAQFVAQGNVQYARILEKMATDPRAAEQWAKQQEEEGRRSISRNIERRAAERAEQERLLTAGQRAFEIVRRGPGRGVTGAEETLRAERAATLGAQGFQYYPQISMPEIEPLPGEAPVDLPGEYEPGGARWGEFFPSEYPGFSAVEEYRRGLKETQALLKRAKDSAPGAMAERERQAKLFMEKRGVSSTNYWMVRSSVIAAAHRRGESGINVEQILEATVQGYIRAGLRPGEARGLVESNRDDIALLGFDAIKHSRDPHAVEALQKSADAAIRAGVPHLDVAVEALEEGRRETAKALGMKGSLTEAQMEAVGELVALSPEERRTTLAALAAGMPETPGEVKIRTVGEKFSDPRARRTVRVGERWRGEREEAEAATARRERGLAILEELEPGKRAKAWERAEGIRETGGGAELGGALGIGLARTFVPTEEEGAYEETGGTAFAVLRREARRRAAWQKVQPGPTEEAAVAPTAVTEKEQKKIESEKKYAEASIDFAKSMKETGKVYNKSAMFFASAVADLVRNLPKVSKR